jgi:polyribonucleotide nucleotidyltransferase
LVHISELEWRRVEKVEDVVQEGEIMQVKLIGVDNQGRIKLSRRALLEKPEGYVEPERSERPERAGAGGGRDRGRGGRDRGGRGDRR